MAHLQVEAKEQMALAAGKPFEIASRSQNATEDWDEDAEDIPEFAEPELPDSGRTDDDMEDGEFTPEPEPVTVFPGSALKCDSTSKPRRVLPTARLGRPKQPARRTSRRSIPPSRSCYRTPTASRGTRVPLGHDSRAYTKGEIAALVSWFDMHKDAERATVPGAQAIEDAKILCRLPLSTRAGVIPGRVTQLPLPRS